MDVDKCIRDLVEKSALRASTLRWGFRASRDSKV